jgi:formate dehydrogenase major subunit
MTDTAALADVVLPGSTPMETDGSYINTDGQTRSFKRLTQAPAGVDNLAIVTKLGEVLGIKLTGIIHNGHEQDSQAQFTLPENQPLFARTAICDPALIKFKQKLDNAGLR